MDNQPPLLPSSSAPTPSLSMSMRRLLAMGLGVRVIVDTGIQLFSPYLSVIAAGLGISIVTLGALNSLRSLMGLAGPQFGHLTDRHGYRFIMRLLLLLGAAGMFIFSFGANQLTSIVGVVFMGLGLFSFAAILQAYLSAFIPYHRRARGLGTVEFAWAFAGIVGLFVSGLLIERFDWRAPFWLLGTGLMIAFFVFGTLPKTQRARISVETPAGGPSLRHWLDQLRKLVKLNANVGSTWAAIIVAALIVFATVNVSIVYGTWLSDEYGLNAARLGLVALYFGLADLAAIALVSFIGDRFGKYRTVTVFTTCSVIAYLLLPFLNFGLLAAVVGLILARFTFEVGMVSNISLLTEQVPAQRAKVMTLASAGVTIGLALANITGPSAYSTWGVIGIGWISAAAALLATMIFLRWVTER